MSNQKTAFAEVIQPWFNFFALRAPKADQLDCGGCTMASRDPQNSARWQAYKCCTFQPFVANFMLGARIELNMASIEDVSPRASLRPLGLIPTRQTREHHERTPEVRKGASHLCVFYRKGGCSIWEFRPGECRSHVCVGTQSPTVATRWFQFESGLAQMALAHLGFSPRELREEVAALDEPPVALTSLSREAAVAIYVESWRWFRDQEPAEASQWLAFDKSEVRA